MGLGEQLGHDGRNPVKVPCPVRTAQPLGNAIDGYGRRKASGVHLRPVRHVNHIRLQRDQLARVLFFGAGIVLVIIGIVELLGVDEDRHDHAVAGLFPRPNEAQVPLMQRTHRGHDGDAFARGFPSGDFAAQFNQRADNFGCHVLETSSENTWSGPGKDRAVTSSA